MLKRCKVVMLPTNKPSKLGNLATYQKRSLAKVIKEGINPIGSTVQFWNLYIISDDEIKEGDCFLYYNKNNQLEGIARCIKEEGENNTLVEKYSKVTGFSKFYIGILGCKKYKIIATTDIKLGTSEYSDRYRESYFNPLPQPSQQFIEKYIEEYNKGNIITDVLVEYELISNEEYFGNTFNPDDDVPYFDENLKINPKDNSLNICFID